VPDGIIDLEPLRESGKIRTYLRKILFINPIVKEFRGYVLDVGCGVGIHLREYHSHSLGIDASEKNVKAGQEEKLNIIKGDANTFVQENTFDTVLLSHLLEHLSEPSKVLRNAYLSTKIGGRIIVVVPCLRGFLTGFNDLIGHKQFISELYIDQHLFRRFGCKKVKSHTFPPFEIPYFGRYQELRIIYQKERS